MLFILLTMDRHLVTRPKLASDDHASVLTLIISMPVMPLTKDSKELDSARIDAKNGLCADLL